MSDIYRYDAFVSYRHITPDKPLAEHLQRLLEAFVPPKNISPDRRLHIFRDETELPSSNSLSRSIEEALEQSRYLIVICSPETEKSMWCMQEISYFKQLHKGKNDHIITMLVGFADKVYFPETLRFETEIKNGEVHRKEIEPLAANACAKTLTKAKKKLKTEYLRLAAALLGCSYDDLFRREKRRQSHRRMRIITILAVTMTLIAAISISSLIVISSQKRTIEAEAHELLVNQTQTLVRESNELLESGDSYGARNVLIDALPDDDNKIPRLNNALNLATVLTGSYEKEQFTAVKKISHSNKILDCCLLEKGTRLLTINDDCCYLWDTETGKLVEKYENTLPSDFFFYSNQSYVSFSLDNKKDGVFSFCSEGSILLNTGMFRVFTNEQPVTESAFYLLDKKANCVARISPKDGSKLWTYKNAEDVLSFDNYYGANATDEAIVVRADTMLRILSSNDGTEIVSCDINEIETAIEDNYSCNWYSQNYLISAGNHRVAVFSNKSNHLTKCFVTPKTDELLMKLSFRIVGDTLYLTGEKSSYTLLAKPFLAAYDLRNGKELWYSEAEDILGGNSFIEYFSKKQTGAITDTIVASIGNCLFVVDAYSGKKYANLLFADNFSAMYCSQNGKVFLISENKSEICVDLTNYKGDDLNNHMNKRLLRTREFDERYPLASYDNGTYVGIKENGSDAVILRNVENPNCTNIFKGEKGIKRVSFSPDGKHFVAALFENDKKLFVCNIGNHPKSLETNNSTDCDFTFWGNDKLVKYGEGTITVFDANTLKAIKNYTGIHNFSDIIDSQVLSKSNYLFLPKEDNSLVIIDKNLKPIHNLTNIHFCFSSPTGNLSLFNIYEEADQQWSSYLFNVKTGKKIKLDAKELTDNTESYAWSTDEKTLYLLMSDNAILAYDCETGTQIIEGTYPRKITSLVCCENNLCIVDINRNLIKTVIENNIIKPEKTFLLEDDTFEADYLTYISINDGSTGILINKQSGKAWLIDIAQFECYGIINNYIGMDITSNLIFTEANDSLYCYSMLDAKALRNRLRALL